MTSAAAMDYLESFRVVRYAPMTMFGVDVSITNSVVWMWVAAGTSLVAFLLLTMRRQLVPGRAQLVAELAWEFVENLVRNNIRPQGWWHVPLLFTLFHFVLFCNWIGLIPGAFTPTSQIVVTGTLAACIFAYTVVLRIVLHGPRFLLAFVPRGTPAWLWPLMIPIEVLSFAARPVTLAVRLFANMTAGHTVLGVIAGLGLAIPWFAAWAPLGMSVVLLAAEVFIGAIQAYIFTVLSCVYIDDAYGE